MTLSKPMLHGYFLSCLNSHAFIRKDANMNFSRRRADSGAPFIKPGDELYANSPRSVIDRKFHVFLIGAPRDISEVAYSIVARIAIYVVQYINGPLPVVYGPSNSVGQKRPVEHHPFEVSVPVHPSKSLPTCKFPVPCTPLAFGKMRHFAILPIQNACIRIISQCLTKHLWCDFALGSHGADPLRIGQGLALLTQRLRPDFIPNIQQFCNPKGRLQAAREWALSLEVQQ